MSFDFVPLSELVKPTRPKVKPTDFPELPFLGMEHVEPHTMRVLGSVPARSMKSAGVRFESGDVLYGRLRPYLNKVARPNFSGICSAEFIVLPENDRVCGPYLQYLLNSAEFVSFAGHLDAGDRPRVDFGQIGAYPVPLLTIGQQRRVVAEIEEQFSRLDEAVANLQRIKASVARYRAAVLSEAVGADQSEDHFVSVGSLLREPIVNGLSIKESATPTAVRALRLSAMTDAGFDYSDHRFLPIQPSKVDDIVVREGDFFVSRGNGSLSLVCRGTVAQTPPFPVIFPDTMMRLRFTDQAVMKWVAMLWPSRWIRAQIESRIKTTAGIYKIAQPQVASITLPLPPPSRRAEVLSEVDRRLSIVRGVEAQVEANLKRAQALRQAILAKAFRGAGADR